MLNKLDIGLIQSILEKYKKVYLRERKKGASGDSSHNKTYAELQKHISSEYVIESLLKNCEYDAIDSWYNNVAKGSKSSLTDKEKDLYNRNKAGLKVLKDVQSIYKKMFGTKKKLTSEEINMYEDASGRLERFNLEKLEKEQLNAALHLVRVLQINYYYANMIVEQKMYELILEDINKNEHGELDILNNTDLYDYEIIKKLEEANSPHIKKEREHHDAELYCKTYADFIAKEIIAKQLVNDDTVNV